MELPCEELYARGGWGRKLSFYARGVVKYHLETSEGEESVKEALKENAYVDNVMALVSTEEEA